MRPNEYYKYQNEDGIHYISKAENKQFSVYNANEQSWDDLFVTGVNIGAAKPGAFPGDFAITKAEYLRWFKYISDMNVNSIRVYVAQMPEFYQALKEFNDTSPTPLYLFHGVYLNEADIAQYRDPYAADGWIKNNFLQDIRNIVDIIHGNAEIEQTAGNAGGVYAADVSRYVVGWILGVEWEADFVETTNANNAQLAQYDGAYIRTQDATPFEIFLAEAADTAISYETQNYQEQRPLAMSNWVTSDPLAHPGEPNPDEEDAVSVDMEKLLPTENFAAGLFASYHIYPYYPDMFNYDEAYLQGDPVNSYKAYIEDLNAYHSMPVLVSEVGLPASRGITHENIHSGFNQGHISETQQGEMLTSLIGDIYTEEMMGAIVFSWQDEWFKRTWNTEMLDVAERRPYWIDYQTNEQNFGILGFDPGEETSASYVDGDTAEWDDADLVAQNSGYSLYMKSDEKFLYLMVEGDFDGETIYIPFDTIPDQGNTRWEDTDLNTGADFMLVLDGEDNSTVLVDAYYDPTYFLYGSAAGYDLGLIPRNLAWEQKDSGQFVPITMMMDRGWKLPTGETIPYSVFDTGALRYGIANPDLEGYDSLADFYSKDGRTEIRLPWLLLNVSDPSSGKILSDLYKNEDADNLAHQNAGPFQVGIYTSSTQDTLQYGQYTWQRWDTPTYHERLKQSYYILQDYFGGLAQSSLPAKSEFELFWGRWNQTQFSDISNWFPIQPVLNYALAFLLSVIVYFFLVLLYIHGKSAFKTRRAEVLRQRICAAVDGEVPLEYSARRRRHAIEKISRPFSRDNMLIFNRILEDADGEEKKRVCDIMLKLGYADFISKQLKTRDTGNLILLVRLIGDLGLSDLAGPVKKLLYKYKGNTDLQYQGLMTLSLLGDYGDLVSIAMDESFVQTLSFRSLQEILKAYTGDKQQFYEKLLGSPDMFIRRISIKRIGAEKFTDLSGKIYPFLSAENFNVVIDAARTLGQLCYRPAAPRIAELLEDDRWEVRAVAVTALAQIDLEGCEQKIIGALGDREWQVRSNAALVLSKLPHIDSIVAQVKASGDRYALEVLQYMITTHGIWGKKQ